MGQDTTLHVKVEPAMAEALKALARRRKKTVGELVRQAIAACYQADLSGLTLEQDRALAAYCGGFISIGRFSEAMGMNVLAAREWMQERGIEHNSSFGEDDAANA